MTSFLAMSPSQERLVGRLWERIATTTKDDDHLIDIMMQPNWVDMMLACVQTHNRSALAATVAAMHNAIVSLQKHPTTCSSANSDSDKDTFVNALTADQLVMNTILRQIVPVHSIISQEARDTSAQATRPPNGYPCSLSSVANVDSSQPCTPPYLHKPSSLRTYQYSLSTWFSCNASTVKWILLEKHKRCRCWVAKLGLKG
jgi:hypothetical protein